MARPLKGGGVSPGIKEKRKGGSGGGRGVRP